MKYVYVLTSSNNDLYYEQCLLSVSSLRMNNPNASIVVLVDEKTNKDTEVKRQFDNVLSEVRPISLPCELSQKEASRWIKTSIHHYVSENFLYIDVDTIICDNITCEFYSEIQIGAVLDNHVNLEKHYLKEYFRKEDKNAGFNSSYKSNKRFNGGIIFNNGNSSANSFFEKWHSLWRDGLKKGCSQDMPSLNQANFELNNIISELNGTWNCQISHNGLPFLSDAKIIHYYATSLNFQDSPFILASNHLLQEINKTGEIPDYAMELLKTPKSAFEPNSRIMCGKAELDVLNSKYFSLMLRFRKKMPKLFKIINSFIIRILAGRK